MAMVESPMQEQPQRKKMRKGTKSCAECRRRKLKCTYGAGNETCVPCLARGSRCITQECAVAASASVSPRMDEASLERRVKVLEKRLQEALQQPEKAKDAQVSVSIPVLASELGITTLDSELERIKHKSPGSLGFSHNAFATGDPPAEQAGPQAVRNYRLCEIFRSMLPPVDVLREFADALAMRWACMQRAVPNFLFPTSQTVGDYIIETLESYNPDLYELAKVVALIACGLIQMDDLPNMGFNGDVAEISLQYVKVVEKLITTDDELASRIDAVEIMFILVIYYTDVGRPRKAWLTNGRAIQFAQLLGIDQCLVVQKDIEQRQRQYALWFLLCMEDRKQGLMMGLPAATLDFKFSQDDASKVTLSTAQGYFLEGMDICGQILRRDRAPSMSFTETLRIDQELMRVAERKLSKTSSLAKQPDEDLLAFSERVMVWSFHNLIRVFLHLPFLLKSPLDERYSYSRSTAVECARSHIFFYLQFYLDPALGPFKCRTMDFQAFISAMALLVNLIDENSDRSNEKRDWALVNECIRAFRGSEEPRGMVGVQAANALQTVKDTYNQESGRVVTVDVPFFGRITVKCKPPPQAKPLMNTSVLQPMANTNVTYNYQQPFPATPEDQTWAQVCWDANRFDHSLELPSLHSMSNMASLQFEFDLDQDWNMLGADELMVQA